MQVHIKPKTQCTNGTVLENTRRIQLSVGVVRFQTKPKTKHIKGTVLENTHHTQLLAGLIQFQIKPKTQWANTHIWDSITDQIYPQTPTPKH